MGWQLQFFMKNKRQKAEKNQTTTTKNRWLELQQAKRGIKSKLCTTKAERVWARIPEGKVKGNEIELEDGVVGW